MRRTENFYLEAIQRLYNISNEIFGVGTFQMKGQSLVSKAVCWWASFLRWVVTFGKEWDYKTRLVCTFGVVYIPEDFSNYDPRTQYAALLHEAAHLSEYYYEDPDLLFSGSIKSLPPKTSAWYRLLFLLKYILYPLPFWKATFRSQVEYSGYLQNVRVLRDFHHYTPAQFKQWFISTFCSASYGWMMSRSDAEAMFERMDKQVLEESWFEDWEDRLFLYSCLREKI